jgi:hypothetical protein
MNRFCFAAFTALVAFAAYAAPSARAQDTITLNFFVDGASRNDGFGPITLFANSNQLTLTNGVAVTNVTLSTLQFQPNGQSGGANMPLTTNIDFFPNPLPAFSSAFTFNVAATNNSFVNFTTLRYEAATANYSLGQGRNLQLTLVPASTTNPTSGTTTLNVNSTFLYTVTPEPASLALFALPALAVAVRKRRQTK